jgi:uncharacterized membrane protein (DUF485 family)
MDSAPNDPPQKAAHDAHVAPNARLGLALFAVYLALYLGFMGIAAFKYEWFNRAPFGGVNLAILYGMGLIVAALLLALLYMALCKRDE